MPSYFASGQIVNLTGFDEFGETDFLCPVRVIEDTADKTVLYTAVNTPLWGRWNLLERVKDPAASHDLVPGEWRSTEFVSISYPRQMFSTWVMWQMPARAFIGWYVNIERPLTRTRGGFRTGDLTLDITVNPDMSWQWKDDHEFQQLIGLGYYSEELAAKIRNAGQLAIEHIQSRAAPFDEPWQDWLPEIDWELPKRPKIEEAE